MRGSELRRRRDRALFQTVPAGANTSGLRSELKTLVEGIPDNDDVRLHREIDSADLEIFVERTPAGSLEYHGSYFLPENPQTDDTPEEDAWDLFDYTKLEPYAGQTLSEVTTLSVDAADSDIFALSPVVNDTEDQEDIKITGSAKPGVELASLIAAMDETAGPWGIQILMSASGDASCQMEIRLITQSGRAQSRGEVIQAIRQWSEEGAVLSYRPRKLDNAQAVRKAFHPEDEGFTAEFSYSVGFLPVPRGLALKTGIGGTVSGLEQYSASQAQSLLSNNHPLGFESNFGADADIEKRLALGLPNQATAVLHATTTDDFAKRLISSLWISFRQDNSTVVFCQNKEQLALFERCYSCLLNDHDDNTVEHVSSAALEKWLSAPSSSQRQPLRDWARELLADDAKIYVFNFSNSPQTATRQSRLLYALSNAAASLADELSTDQPVLGHLVLASPNIVADKNSENGLLKRALRKTASSKLGVDIITTYSHVHNNKQTVKQLVDAVDAVSADNAGQPARLVGTDTLPQTAQEQTAELAAQGAELNVVRINASESFAEPIIVPMMNTARMNCTPSIEEILDTNTAPSSLVEALDAVYTIDLPKSKNPSGSTNDKLQATAVGKNEPTSHLTRQTGLPPTVEYDESSECYVCVSCRTENPQNVTRRECTHEGLQRAIECCSSLSQVDREDIRRLRRPRLKIRPEDVDDPKLETQHLLFLKALYLVHTERVDPYFEYSPLLDSGTKIRDAYGLDSDDIEMIEDRGYITTDTHPYVLYTLKTEGRQVLNEPWKKGDEFGAGIGELNETLQHHLMVSLDFLKLRKEYRDNPNRHVKRYVPVEVLIGGETKQKNIDVAVVDSEDNIIHAREAECLNNDEDRSLVSTYQKMCAVDPESARWIIPKGRTSPQGDERGAAGLLESLATLGAQGKIAYSGTTYSPSTAVSEMDVDEPGLTDIQTIDSLKKGITDIEQVLRTNETQR